MNQENSLLSTKLLSRRWNIAPRTLERWRTKGRGPQFVRIGRHVRYRLTDIIDFEVTNTQASSATHHLSAVRCAA